jgi:hypothetical protein
MVERGGIGRRAAGARRCRTRGCGTHNARFAAAAHVRPAAVANTNVKGTGAKAKFAPAKLSAHWSGPTEGTCTTKNEGFTVSNTTKKAITLTYQGSAFAQIAAHTVDGICAWGSGKTTLPIGLVGSTKTLSVKLS